MSPGVNTGQRCQPALSTTPACSRGFSDGAPEVPSRFERLSAGAAGGSPPRAHAADLQPSEHSPRTETQVPPTFRPRPGHRSTSVPTPTRLGRFARHVPAAQVIWRLPSRRSGTPPDPAPSGEDGTPSGHAEGGARGQENEPIKEGALRLHPGILTEAGITPRSRGDRTLHPRRATEVDAYRS